MLYLSNKQLSDKTGEDKKKSAKFITAVSGMIHTMTMEINSVDPSSLWVICPWGYYMYKI